MNDFSGQSRLIFGLGAEVEPGVITFPRKNPVRKNKPSRGVKMFKKADRIFPCIAEPMEDNNHGQCGVRICAPGNDFVVVDALKLAALGIERGAVDGLFLFGAKHQCSRPNEEEG